MNKKLIYSLMGVLVIASMILSACGQATVEPTVAVEPTKAPDQPKATEPETPADMWADVDPSGQTVIFWHQHTRAREEALLAIVDEFNTTNEWGITVEAAYQGSYNDIFNKMLGVLNTAEAPGIVVAYQNQAATYQLADGLVDMNSLIASPKWGMSEADQADFFPAFWQQDIFPTYGNARLAIAPNRSMEVLYYNADWLAELKAAGAIDFDGPPTTPEQFKAAACAAVENPFSKAKAEGPLGYELSVDASRFASWTFAFGGDIFDYNTSQYTLDSEAAVAAMTFLQELFNEGCAQIVTESFGDQTNFGAGKTLFTVGSSSGLPFYTTAVNDGAAFEWSVAAIPHTTPDPVMNIYGASVSIPVTTPENELASWLFVKYYTGTEAQTKWALASQYFPVRASVAAGLADYFAQDPAYKTAFDMLKYGRFEPPVAAYDPVRNLMADAMAAIANGEDVASTLAPLNVEGNSILGEAMTSPLPTPVPTNTPAPTATPAPAIGTVDNPIKVLFVPSTDANAIIAGGEELAKVLKDATGLEFVVSVPTSYAATIEEMCASPTNTIGFIPGLGYVFANQLCGVDVSFKAIRRGWDVYWAQVVVRRDSDIQTLADLNGKKWAYPDAASTSGYLAALPLFANNGVIAGEVLEAGGHPQVIRAVADGSADFGTTFFSAPAKPEGEPAWKVGDEPDIPADLVDSCAPTDDGKDIKCGGWTVLDARRNLAAEIPDVVQQVRILALSPAIPNDTLSFGPEFPADVRALIEAALLDFATNNPDGFKTAMAAYSWTGLSPATDAEYDVVRQMIEAAGLTIEFIK